MSSSSFSAEGGRVQAQAQAQGSSGSLHPAAHVNQEDSVDGGSPSSYSSVQTGSVPSSIHNTTVSADAVTNVAFLDVEMQRAASVASARWSDCLACLLSSLPLLTANPWMLILQPPFAYDYFDSLTETLANLHAHTDDLELVRSILQQVYHSFVDLGNFAKHQPAFYFEDIPTLKRFVRLLEQVTHKNSDKALYPNILSLLTPTLCRPSLFPILLELRMLSCLFRFAQDHWIPTPVSLIIICAILTEMSADPLMRDAMQREPGWERLCRLSRGNEPGLTKEQQMSLQAVLKHHVEVDFETLLSQNHFAEDDDEEFIITTENIQMQATS